jgi:hypothetical protein
MLVPSVTTMFHMRARAHGPMAHGREPLAARAGAGQPARIGPDVPTRAVAEPLRIVVRTQSGRRWTSWRFPLP